MGFRNILTYLEITALGCRASYTESPLRAFEEETGVQPPASWHAHFRVSGLAVGVIGMVEGLLF